MDPIPWLSPNVIGFPAATQASRDPDGLLAAGADLTMPWLLEAYAHGIFPWFESDDDYILWWSPSERAVLRPGTMKVSRSLAKRIRNGGFSICWDNNFEAVINHCAEAHPSRPSTWITPRMRTAYLELFESGFAHCVEVYQDKLLVGGLYGLSLGAMFFGESMFSRVADASKVAFYHLQNTLEAENFTLIDCQMENEHLNTLGIELMQRANFLQLLEQNRLQPTRLGPWRFATS
ncbi:MAG: leucyl/phenylalanyl-tRNA--protein transferase [Pseudomonadota bacterium]